jgi:hypothetical protein
MPVKRDNQNQKKLETQVKKSNSSDSSKLLCLNCRLLREEKKSEPNKKSARQIVEEFQTRLKQLDILDNEMKELMKQDIEEEKAR